MGAKDRRLIKKGDVLRKQAEKVMLKGRKPLFSNNVLIELTSHCNFSCSFCPSDSMDRKKTVMPRELWEGVLHEISEKKLTKRVLFHLMGEPFLHRDIFDAIHLANKLGLSVGLFTNGALLNSERASKLIQNLKSGTVILSMQNVSPETFQKRSRGTISWSGYIERLQEFIQLVERTKPPFSVRLDCMVDIRGLGWNLRQIFLEQKRIQAVYDQWREKLHLRDEIKINIFDPTKTYPLGEHCSFFVKQAGNWNNQHIPDTMKVIKRSSGHCTSISDTFAVLSNGSCTYCCDDYEGELNLGNANYQTIEEIYYGEKASKIREAEKKSKFIENQCQICRGSLVYKKNGKMVSSRNLLTDYYIFKDHLAYKGYRSSIRKIMEAVKRRA